MTVTTASPSPSDANDASTDAGGAAADQGEPSWEPPGPGSWEILADHYPRPVTAVMRGWPRVWSRAFTDSLHELALPIDAAEMALVNDIPYAAFHSKGGDHVPPRWMMHVLLRVVPPMRRAEKALDRAITDRVWLAHARQWYDIDRPAIVADQRELTRVDPDELTDAELADHLRLVERRLFEYGYRHIAMGMPDLLAVGLFVIACEDWGIAHAEALGLLAGSSPASTGRHPELLRLRETLAGAASPATLEEIRSVSDAARSALDDYLEVHGHRVVDGYDVDCATLVERPDLIVRLATAPERSDGPARSDEATAAIRARVPADRRADFDRMLADARGSYGLRDDNNAILVGWAVGLTRRAMLAAGRRLIVGDGAEGDADLAVEATIPELTDALTGGGAALDPDELRLRRARRRSLPSSRAPRTLGPSTPSSPTDWPGRLGTVMRIFGLHELAADRDRPLQGIGIGDRPYTGTARIVRGGIDGGAFDPGDVLVAPMTSPSYNVLLSLAGAVVTEEGGLLSHAAMMARELALPAVLNVAGATELITEGATITVDPASGTITVP